MHGGPPMLCANRQSNLQRHFEAWWWPCGRDGARGAEFAGCTELVSTSESHFSPDREQAQRAQTAEYEDYIADTRQQTLTDLPSRLRVARLVSRTRSAAGRLCSLEFRSSRPQAFGDMSQVPGQGQDWKPVVFSKKPTGAAASSEKNVRAVRFEGCSGRPRASLHGLPPDCSASSAGAARWRTS